MSQSEINAAWEEGFTFGYNQGDLEGYERGWNDGYETGKGFVSKENTQFSDNTFKSVFPKHLKTDKDFLEKLQKSKEECLVWIDFEKIHSVMKHLDWKWGLGEDAEVPSLSKLVLSAQKQLDSAIKGFLENTDNDCIAYCGGLKASVQGFADGFCRVTLEFIVSDWDSEIGDEK